MFELKNITKTFGGEVALKNVSLSISGGMNYIIGASVAEKQHCSAFFLPWIDSMKAKHFIVAETLKNYLIRIAPSSMQRNLALLPGFPLD